MSLLESGLFGNTLKDWIIALVLALLILFLLGLIRKAMESQDLTRIVYYSNFSSGPIFSLAVTAPGATSGANR